MALHNTFETAALRGAHGIQKSPGKHILNKSPEFRVTVELCAESLNNHGWWF